MLLNHHLLFFFWWTVVGIPMWNFWSTACRSLSCAKFTCSASCWLHYWRFTDLIWSWLLQFFLLHHIVFGLFTPSSQWIRCLLLSLFRGFLTIYCGLLCISWSGHFHLILSYICFGLGSSRWWFFESATSLIDLWVLGADWSCGCLLLLGDSCIAFSIIQVWNNIVKINAFWANSQSVH